MGVKSEVISQMPIITASLIKGLDFGSQDNGSAISQKLVQYHCRPGKCYAIATYSAVIQSINQKSKQVG